MGNQTLSTSKVSIGGFELSVTSRSCGDPPIVLQDLTARTIGAWLFLAKKIETKTWVLSDNEIGSVESRYLDARQKTEPDFTLADAWGDARVTIWDTQRGSKTVDFHLNSDDDFQTALDTWYAHKAGIQEALEKVQPAAIQQGKAQPAPADQKPATPKGSSRQPTASNNGATYTKKEALNKLQPGDSFNMKVVQIEKHSKDGKDFYDFFEPYGGKAGQYSAGTVYTDNEVALESGFIEALDDLGIKPGQALTGSWIVNCTIGKPKTKTIKGEEKTFTNIYINRLEAQAQTA